MNAPESFFLPDVQASADPRNIAIQRVGVKAVRHPVQLGLRDGVQSSVALIDMSVGLKPSVKGTHMSRFLEILQAQHAPLSASALPELMNTMTTRLDAENGFIRLSAPVFLMKTAPISGVRSLLDYQLTWEVSSTAGQVEVQQTVVVPVTSLCPCSKEISAYGAHNQRSHITLTATLLAPLSIEDQIAIAESAASCEVYGLLKRSDEKFVTERAYDNPKFVEDLVRDIALALEQQPAIGSYRIECENFESIHNHSAYALIERSRS